MISSPDHPITGSSDAGLRRAQLGGRKTQSVALHNPEGIQHGASLALVAALPSCATRSEIEAGGLFTP